MLLIEPQPSPFLPGTSAAGFGCELETGRMLACVGSMALNKLSETERLSEILRAEHDLPPEQFANYVAALSIEDRELYLGYEAARALRAQVDW